MNSEKKQRSRSGARPTTGSFRSLFVQRLERRCCLAVDLSVELAPLEQHLPDSEHEIVLTPTNEHESTKVENDDLSLSCILVDGSIDMVYSEYGNLPLDIVSGFDVDMSWGLPQSVEEDRRKHCQIDQPTTNAELATEDAWLTNLPGKIALGVDASATSESGDGVISNTAIGDSVPPNDVSVPPSPVPQSINSTQASQFHASSETVRPAVPSVSMSMKELGSRRSNFAAPIVADPSVKSNVEPSFATLFQSDHEHRIQASKGAEYSRPKMRIARAYQAPLLVGQPTDSRNMHVVKSPSQTSARDVDHPTTVDDRTDVGLEEPKFVSMVLVDQQPLRAESDPTNEVQERTSLFSLRKQQLPLAVFLTFANSLGGFVRGIDRRTIANGMHQSLPFRRRAIF